MFGVLDAPKQFWPTLPSKGVGFFIFQLLRSCDTLSIVTFKLGLVPVMAILMV